MVHYTFLQNLAIVKTLQLCLCGRCFNNNNNNNDNNNNKNNSNNNDDRWLFYQSTLYIFFYYVFWQKKYLSRVSEMLPVIANASLQRRLNMANTANELITLDISNYVNYTSCYEQGLCLYLFITVTVWTGL